MKINISGNIFGTTGYAVHTSELSKAIRQLNPETSIEVPIQKGWEQNCPDMLYKMILDDYRGDVEIAIQTPPFWPLKLSERPKHFIGFLVFEGTQIMKSWGEICQRKDVKQIWVPSKHTKDAIIMGMNAKIEDANKIKIVPHGHDPKLFNLKPKIFKQLDQFKSTKFTFIWNKGWMHGEKDRSALPHLLRNFCAEFKKEEPVRLIVKLNPSYLLPGFNLNKEVNRMKLPKDRPEILFITSALPYETLPHFYTLGDCYISTSRGEAFNIPVLEAMACGLPAIVNRFGGESDYVNNKNGWLLNYDLIDTPKDMFHTVYEEAMWGEVKGDCLRKAMREAFASPQKTKQMGLKAHEDSRQWTWAKSAEKAMMHLITPTKYGISEIERKKKIDKAVTEEVIKQLEEDN